MTDSPTLSYTLTCKIPTLCLKPDKGVCQSLPIYVIIGSTPVGSIPHIQNVFLPLMPANLLVIVEFACHGDLLGYLLKSRGLPDTYYQTTGKLTRVTAKKMMMFAWQIADGMNFLVENKVKSKRKLHWTKWEEIVSKLSSLAHKRVNTFHGQISWAATIYTWKPEIPVRRSDGSRHSVWEASENLGFDLWWCYFYALLSLSSWRASIDFFAIPSPATSHFSV